ncbi:MAG: hydrolase [Herbinix sp.]|jgi:8-oxo-dGTP diphosphatase|nr:hydrolase [Herbinix sp.]
MLKVNFYDRVEDKLLKFAVIVARSQGKWVLCKHKERTTYEFPGGHREAGEDILTTAKRELLEETGAVDYSMRQICVYSVAAKDDTSREESFGMLYYADIRIFKELPNLEIEKIELFDELPDNWTYPEIQPFLLDRVNSEFNN